MAAAEGRGGAFSPQTAVVVSLLPEEERLRCLELLASRAAQTESLGCGPYAAAWVRLEEEGASSSPKKKKKERRRRPGGGESALSGVVEGVDCSLYPRFAALCAEAGRPPPPGARVRPLRWIQRLADDVYDQAAQREKRAPFPDFVVRHLTDRQGLEGLVAGACWDLLATTHARRTESAQVETFARFLGAVYDDDDVDFFLRVRGLLKRTPRHREDALSFAECGAVARALFAGQDAAIADFLATVDAHCAGTKAAGLAANDTRTIPTTDFLRIALLGFHQAKRADAAEPAASAEAAEDAAILRGICAGLVHETYAAHLAGLADDARAHILEVLREHLTALVERLAGRPPYDPAAIAAILQDPAVLTDGLDVLARDLILRHAHLDETSPAVRPPLQAAAAGHDSPVSPP